MHLLNIIIQCEHGFLMFLVIAGLEIETNCFKCDFFNMFLTDSNLKFFLDTYPTFFFQVLMIQPNLGKYEIKVIEFLIFSVVVKIRRNKRNCVYTLKFDVSQGEYNYLIINF